jgi:lysophospholipase L1-like esterase
MRATIASFAALLGALVGLTPATLANAGAATPSARCADRTVHVAGDRTTEISIRCHGLAKPRIEVKREPRHGLLGRIDQKHDRVDYRPDDGYGGPDRLVIQRSRGERSWTTAIAIRVGPKEGLDATAPACTRVQSELNYATPAQVSITCRGAGIEDVSVDAGPFSGTLSNVSVQTADGASTLTGTYTPDPLFVGQDAIVVRAEDPDGSAFGALLIDVRPWRMRAIGDSVTAGFGYFGNGDPMPLDDLLACKPATVVTNRCSSNSDAGPNYTGPPSWNLDFGLSNNVAWPAQFANGWQGGGHISAPVMFQNRAVTGSAPSDWLPSGLLNGELNAIVAEDPDLIAMTMGANPLLDDLLLTTEGEECSFETTVAELEACVQTFFNQEDLSTRLQQIYTAVLGAPDAEVVVFEYHLAIPAVNLFSVWQLETIGNYFNAQIAAAVSATKAAVGPAKAARLHLIEAQIDPASPSPTTLPRFNIGLPPDPPYQTWTPAFDCGGGDMVDGHSHQSDPTQTELHVEHPFTFCTGDPWIIDADSGIHPSRDGYAQFAATLTHVAESDDLIPPLP